MGKKIWSMSTTVRNPNRIKDFLYVLSKIDGKIWNTDTQIEYQIRLIQERYYVPTYENLNEEQISILKDAVNPMTYEEAEKILKSKKYVDPDMRGRTSFKPLQKWGLAFIIDSKIHITETGKQLIDGSLDLGDVCFKSLIKWQYPSTVDNEFNDGYNVKPFIATLHLINEVNKECIRRNIKSKGISREELGIFVLSLINYRDINNKVYDLLEFREKCEKLDTFNNERKEYTEKFIGEYLKEFDNASYGNIRDYTDNIIRYFRLTRYLYIRGGGYYIDIEPRRLKEILMLLKTDNASCVSMPRNEYINYLSDYEKPPLPWETKSILKNIAYDIELEIKRKSTEFKFIIDYRDKETLDIDDFKIYINYLRKKRNELNNLEIKREYTEEVKINEAMNAISNIRKLKGKASIMLEKWINIALNIINDAKLIKPNYPVGDDNEPTFTAPSNVPDIECYYDGFSSICEVTMLTSRDQWYNEGQPVQRHLRDFENNQNTSDVYCLFVAPKMHRDTINTFWVANKYEYEGKKQKIVPLNLTQIVTILEYIKEIKSKGKAFTNDKLKSLYDSILNNIDNVSNSEEWITSIYECIDTWKNVI